MKRGDRFLHNQAEMVVTDLFMEYWSGLERMQVRPVLEDIIRLCESPDGKHCLSGVLAGLDTVETLAREHRVVYDASAQDGVGLLEILAGAQRKGSQVSDIAQALRPKLTDEEWTQIWDCLTLVQQLAEDVGIDAWDHAPDAAPEGLITAAVASGVLDRSVAEVMSAEEITTALREGFSTGQPDQQAALEAAVRTGRDLGHPPLNLRSTLAGRAGDRCGVVMPRVQRHCIRKHGHPGPHRAR